MGVLASLCSTVFKSSAGSLRPPVVVQGCVWSNALDSCTTSPEAVQALPHLGREPSGGQVQQAAALQAADVSGCMPMHERVPMLESMPADGSSRWADPQILRLLLNMHRQLPEGESEH